MSRELPDGEAIPQPTTLAAHDLGGGAVLLVYEVDPEPELPDVLSPAQREIVRCALRGLSDVDIARSTGRSRHTVSNLLRQAFARLGVSSRAELAVRLRDSPFDADDRNGVR